MRAWTQAVCFTDEHPLRLREAKPVMWLCFSCSLRQCAVVMMLPFEQEFYTVANLKQVGF